MSVNEMSVDKNIKTSVDEMSTKNMPVDKNTVTKRLWMTLKFLETIAACCHIF